MTFGGVPETDFKITRGTLAKYRSSDHAERGFCSACGTPLTYRRIGGDRVSVTTGSADHPELLAPMDQLGVESRMPWTLKLAELPELRTEQWLTRYDKTVVGSHQHPDREV